MSSTPGPDIARERWLLALGAEPARRALSDLARGGLLRRALGRRSGARSSHRHSELLYLPHALVTAPVVSRRAAAGAPDRALEEARRSVDGRAVDCLVCLLSGRVARVTPSRQSFAPSVAAPRAASGGGVARAPSSGPTYRALPARLDRDQALDCARDFLLRLSLVFRREKQQISIAEARLVEFWQYPYWVEVFERRPGRFDLRAIDGVTGEPTGAATRGTLLEALIRDHRSALRGTTSPGFSRSSG